MWSAGFNHSPEVDTGSVTAVPCPLGLLGGTPETYHSAGLRRTATSNFHETRDNLARAIAGVASSAGAAAGRPNWAPGRPARGPAGAPPPPPCSGGGRPPAPFGLP